MPPIKMTRAEYEAKYGKAPVATSSTPVAPIKMTRAEYEAKYNPTTMQRIGGALGIDKTIERGKEAGKAYRAGQISGPQFASEAVLGVGSILAKSTGIPKAWEALDYVARGQGKYNPIPEKNLYSDIMTGMGQKISKVAEIPSVKRGLATPSGQSFGRMASSAMDISSLLPVGPAKGAVARKMTLAEEYLAQQARKRAEDAVDKNIRQSFEGQVKDARELEDSAFRAKKGLELLVNEKDIRIPDMKAPLGARNADGTPITKSFDIQKAKPQEIITAINETGNKIAKIARDATVQATAQGRMLDLAQANAVIDSAVQSGNVTPAMATRMKLQLQQTGGTPTGVHDWVESINQKYQTKFDKGTIEDTQASKLANDVARTLRAQLDTVVDRTGYAEAYANNQALKKLFISVAKKANKNVDFGDISTDVGLDTAISILTGNPAYMARTLAERSLRSIIGGVRKNAGMKQFKKATSNVGKYPTQTKLPGANPKVQIEKQGGTQSVPISSRTVTIPRRAMTRPENLLPAPRPKAIPLGGEVLGQKVNAKGELIRAPLGKAKKTTIVVPAKQGAPRVNPKTGRMEKTFTSEVATPSKAPEMPEKLKGNAKAENLHKQITDNVKAQERAYKRGDTVKMSALKKAYNYLIKKWEELVQRVKDTPGKEGGFLGFGKKAESATDRKFRRQDEEMWKKRGMEVVGNKLRKIPNKQRGALGAPAEMGSDALVPPRKQTVKVGLSSVSGRDDLVKSKLVEELDALNAKGQALFKEGKFDEAQNVFNSITQKAKAPIEKRFKGTQFKPKWAGSGTGQGVFQGVPEPNLDFSVEVTGAKDRALLQTILEDISNKDFNQYSLLTYEHHSSDLTMKMGISDQKAGVSIEPSMTISLEKELSLADIKQVNEALSEAGLQFMSLKDGGKTIDLVNLSVYNKNHDEFINQIKKFRELLDVRGIRGSSKLGVSEVRLVGSNAKRGPNRNAVASYEGSKRTFHARNKDYAEQGKINSKVLDVLKYKERVSKGELESIVKSGEVSPAEKAVFSRVLEQIKDGKVAMRDVQKRLMSNLLQLKGGEESKYASYGFDNVGLQSDNAKSFILRTPKYKHGLGGGHMGGDDVYGWTRYSKNGRNGDTASIGEIQSDLNQDPDSIAKLKSSQTARDLERVNEKIAQAEENLRIGKSNYGNSLTPEILERDMPRYEQLKKDRADLEAKLAKEQGQTYDFAREQKLKTEYQLLSNAEVDLRTLQGQEEELMGKEGTVGALIKKDDSIEFQEKKIADIKKRIATLEKSKPSPLGGQIVALSKDYKYRDRILEETIAHLIQKEKVKTIRIATPSTVAKIEGYAGAGDDMMPYEWHGDRNAELTPGDEIGVGGEAWIVLDTPAQGRGWGGPPPTSVVAAPAEHVREFSLHEYVREEVDNRIEMLNENGINTDGMNEIDFSKGIKKEDKFNPYEASDPYEAAVLEALKYDAPDGFILTEDNLDEFLHNAYVWDKIAKRVENNAESDLNEIYPYASVNGKTVRVLDEGRTETFEHPSSYDSGELDDPQAIDRDPELAKETFDSTQMGVLNGYYDLLKRWVPKYEKATGAKVKIIEDDNGHTWLEITDPKIPPKTSF